MGSQDTHLVNTLKLKGHGGYIPQVRVVGTVFYAELFNLWSHLSNKSGQFLCSLHCLHVNYKTKQLSHVSSEMLLPISSLWEVGETDYKDSSSCPLTASLPFAALSSRGR